MMTEGPQKILRVIQIIAKIFDITLIEIKVLTWEKRVRQNHEDYKNKKERKP